MKFQLIDTISRLSFWELRFFGPCQRTLESYSSYRNPSEHRKLLRKSQIRKSWHRCGSQCLTHQRLRQSKPSKIEQFPESNLLQLAMSKTVKSFRNLFPTQRYIPSSMVDKSWCCFGLLVLRYMYSPRRKWWGSGETGALRHVEERLRMTWGCLAKSIRFMDFYLSLSQGLEHTPIAENKWK